MTRHALLDNVTHKDLKIRRRFAPGEGFDVNVTRVFPAELPALQGEYPLFLHKNRETGHFEVVALLGFEEGENLYLGGDRWLARALPWTIERQPFLIGLQEQEVDGMPVQVPVVHVDLDHPAVSDSEGNPVFLPHGGEAPLLERINSILRAIHEGQEQAQVFSELLVGLELVESVEIDVEFDDESRHQLRGLSTINEDRLGSLNGDALEVLHRKGHLQSVYMLIASTAQLAPLIERKNARRVS